MSNQMHAVILASLLGILLAAAPAALAQTTWCVDDDAPNDPGPGDPTISDPLEDGSAEHPFDAIQEGINAAAAGDTVLVLDGTYTGVGNENLDFGGKAITVRSAAGDPALCTIDCEGDGRGFYFHSGEGADSIVQGLTITNGGAICYGGGVYCTNSSSPTLANCVITGNSVTTTSGEACGGGVYCAGANPELNGCTITENSATPGSGAALGGGVYCLYSSPMLTNCTISGNSSVDGGGVYCWGGYPTLADCTIGGNHSYADGGAVYSFGSTPTLTNCTVSENSADVFGGGVHYCGTGSNATLTNCTITGNSAVGGGGVYCRLSYPTLTFCTISENSAGDGGGVLCIESSNPTLANCTISANWAAGFGGGVNFYGGNPTLTNCIINENRSDYYGGGVSCYGGNATITNCTFNGNAALSHGGGVFCGADDPVMANCILWGDAPEEIYVDAGSPVLTYCDVQDGWSGTGNIDADPLFLDPDGPDDDPNTWADNDYHLGAGSPCIDAADNTALPPDTADLDNDGDTVERTPLDLDLLPRFVNDPSTEDTGVADPPEYPNVVDMGAQEFGIPGDLDGDCDIDLADLAQLLGSYGETSGMTYEDGDLDGDGDIDLADLAELLSVYGTTCP